MCRRKTVPPLQKFWENKLGIKYSIELEYYKKLCGVSYNEKLLYKNEKYNISTLLEYDKWKKSVLSDIAKLNLKELEEYSRFLNQKSRENEVKFGMSQTFLIPFMLMYVSFFSEIIYEMTDLFEFCIPLFSAKLVVTIVIIIFFIYSFKESFSTKEESSCQYFYQDIKEIVDEELEELKNTLKRAGGD